MEFMKLIHARKDKRMPTILTSTIRCCTVVERLKVVYKITSTVSDVYIEMVIASVIQAKAIDADLASHVPFCLSGMFSI